MKASSRPVWLFDLDNTLHDASRSVFGRLNRSMNDYIATHLTLPASQADALRFHYWKRYGATLMGLERHHGIRAAHFLRETHRLPDLEPQLHMPPADRAALRRLKGRKIVFTNAPAEYARRVLTALDIVDVFEAVVAIEDMRVFGQLRPKPDVRMLRTVLARLKLPAHRCVLVEDTLANLRTARSLGMGTVWMRHYLGSRAARQRGAHHGGHGPEGGVRQHRRPAWVCARIDRLQALRAWPNDRL